MRAYQNSLFKKADCLLFEQVFVIVYSSLELFEQLTGVTEMALRPSDLIEIRKEIVEVELIKLKAGLYRASKLFLVTEMSLIEAQIDALESELNKIEQ